MYLSFLTSPDVAAGTYILEVQSPHLVYSRVRIVVTHSEVVAMRVSIGDHFSNHPYVLPMPLTLRPRPRPIHYIPPEGQKVVGFFGHPMILMASFSLMMLLIMPRIMSNLDSDALDALRSSYDFSTLPPLPPQHLGLMVPPHQQNNHAQPSVSSKNLYPQEQKQHEAYAMDNSLDTFQNQSSPYYNEKSHHDFATTPATDLANHGLYQAYPTAFGDQWAQQQQQPTAGGAVPVQSKKQK
ncbi:hypothetical protein EC991_007299 [Linnemannia zychae]|nr:hypothetical protein EC991_007299 [Linnemannia zychae]